jgi:hypothetical protein
MLSLGISGLSRSATLRVAITLATALLGAALLPGLGIPRANAPAGVLVGTMLFSPVGLGLSGSAVTVVSPDA